MLNRSDSSDARRQALSSLMDGEAAPTNVADACSAWRADVDVRRDWHAWHLIGDVLRSDELAEQPGRDVAFLQALRLRLADEPVPLAPQRPAPPAEPVPLRANGTAPVRARARGWLMAPMAVAAGFVAVAGVMVVTRVMAPEPTGAVVAAASLMAPAASAVLVRDAGLDRYLSAHRRVANGVMPVAAAQQRVHIVFEDQ